MSQPMEPQQPPPARNSTTLAEPLTSTTNSSPLSSSSPAPIRRQRLLLCDRELLLLLAAGQLLSLLITGTGVFSQLLAERDVRIPTTQSCINYALLSLFLIPHYRAYRDKQRRHRLSVSHQPLLPSSAASSSAPAAASSPAAPSFFSVPWYHYLFLAVCDVEGNFLLVTAYQFTTISSIQLLDCATIPLVMLLSFIVFHQRYGRQHIAGAATCILGMALLIVSDQLQPAAASPSPSSSSSASSQLVGDVLVLLGCCCYAVSNIGQERIVKQQQRVEYLAAIGLFGSLVSAVQIAALELPALSATVSALTVSTCLFLCLFTACLLTLYLLTPLLLQRSSALFFNLSILTSDFYSVIAAYAVFAVRLHALYFLAFLLIVAGLVLYELAVTGRSLREAVDALLGRCKGDATTAGGSHSQHDEVETAELQRPSRQ